MSPPPKNTNGQEPGQGRYQYHYGGQQRLMVVTVPQIHNFNMVFHHPGNYNCYIDFSPPQEVMAEAFMGQPSPVNSMPGSPAHSNSPIQNGHGLNSVSSPNYPSSYSSMTPCLNYPGTPSSANVTPSITGTETPATTAAVPRNVRSQTPHPGAGTGAFRNPNHSF